MKQSKTSGDFCLSDKRIEEGFSESMSWYHYKEEDVKEFVRRLKEEIKKFDYKGLKLDTTYLKVKNLIDKLAGEKLTK